MKVKDLTERCGVSKDIILESLEHTLDSTKRECKYWATKGNKEQLRRCQIKYKTLNDVLELSLQISKNDTIE